MIVNSEIRRRDRRGATPEHILYMAVEILRLRVSRGVFAMFQHCEGTRSLTREMVMVLWRIALRIIGLS